MIYNIDSDMMTRLLIFKIDGLIFIVLGIYSFLWCKLKMKRPLFKPYKIKEVMAMEDPMYLKIKKYYILHEKENDHEVSKD